MQVQILLANNTVVSGSNPLPVDLAGGDTVTLNGNVNTVYMGQTATMNVAATSVANSNVTVLGTVTVSATTVANSNVTVIGTAAVNQVALTAFTASQASVTTAISQIASSALANRRTITIKARTANAGIVYIGQANTVATSNGYAIEAGQGIDLLLSNAVSIWATANANTQTIDILESA